MKIIIKYALSYLIKTTSLPDFSWNLWNFISYDKKKILS